MRDRNVANRGYLLKLRIGNSPELVLLILARGAEYQEMILEFIKHGNPV